MGKALLEGSYSSEYGGGMGKPLLDALYSSDYEVGWANHS